MDSSTLRLNIAGMTCPLCEERVAKALSAVPGVLGAKADFARGEAALKLAPEQKAALLMPKLHQAVQEAGYRIVPQPGKETGAKFGQVLGLLGMALLIFWAGKHFIPAKLTGFFPGPGQAASLGALFSVGLLTAPHCLAMCGGIAMSHGLWAAKNAGQGTGIRQAALCFQAGRLLSYSATGAIAGLLGQTFALEPVMRGGLMLLAGAFMLIMALNMVGSFSFLRRLQFRPLRLPGRLAASLRDRFSVSGTSSGRHFFLLSLGMGLANGLMPCGPLQLMQVYALGLDGAGSGAAALAAFCLGTMPALLGVNLFTGHLNQKETKRIFQASALLIMVLALGMMQNGLALTGRQTLAASQNPEGAVARLTATGQEVVSTADFGAFQPIVVQKGLPVIWKLMMPKDKLVGCNNAILVPIFGIEQQLTAGENLISFTPGQSGTFAFTCWMGMITSRITVVDTL
ncbi:MAG: sulfite exporter TauE/SafE family protein [bacterium]|nr:sulfite exporter TauE/SafE family protein [bacterium]